MDHIFFITLCLCIHTSQTFTNIYPNIKQEALKGDPGSPLILTPLIKLGKIKEARAAASVTLDDFKNLQSYSGYFTVNDAFSSNLFFWFFPARINAKNAPVVLWLQGGPGATSLIGLFGENGPFEVKSKGLGLRKYSWAISHNLIYIDNPVGVGYSFTEGGFATNETVIGESLYNALLQFFQLFPDLQKNEFYVTGESYAGKYVPAVAYTIHKSNPSSKLKINLQGIALGNGFTDPINQLDYSDYLYQLGLIDTNARQKLWTIQQQGMDLIYKQKWIEAFHLFDELLDGDLSGHPSLFKNITGFSNYYNYLVSNDTSSDYIFMGKYIQSEGVRRAIHVGTIPFNGGENPVVELNLIEDIMQSVAPWVSELLNNYRVLVYNGQLDIIVAYPLTLNFLQNLDFNAADEYKTAQRHQWWVDGDIAGYVKQAGNLTEVLVRNAGHMVPRDQPKWALDLITRFTHHKPYY